MLHVYFQFVKWLVRAIHLELVVNNSEYTGHGEIYAPASLWFGIYRGMMALRAVPSEY